MIEFDGRTENLQNAEKGTEGLDQGHENYRESEYGQKLISRFPVYFQMRNNYVQFLDPDVNHQD
jgi:hypothetical protein